MNFLKIVSRSIITVGFVIASPFAQAANLGSFTANCLSANAPYVVVPLTGNVGDTFTVTTGTSGCFPYRADTNSSYSLTNGYPDNYGSLPPIVGAVDVVAGTVITVMLVAAGSSGLSFANIGNGAGHIFNVTINPAPAAAAPIPTLSEWAMILMASLMAMFGYRKLRNRRS